MKKYFARIPETQWFVRVPRWVYNRWQWRGIVEISSAIVAALLLSGCNTTSLTVTKPDGTRAQVVNSRWLWTTGSYKADLTGFGSLQATASKADNEAIRAGAEGAASGAMKAALIGIKP